MRFGKPVPNSEKSRCQVCQNSFVAKKPGIDSARCPYCQSAVGTQAANRSLDEITGYKILQTLEWNTPAKVYVAEHLNQRFLVTLLDEDSDFYKTLARCRDQGQPDPFHSASVAPHPNLLRTYPATWKDEVAIAMMDFMDGKTLGEWIHAVGRLDVPDAVEIVLQCLRLSSELSDLVDAGQIHPNAVQVFENGEVKIATGAEITLRLFSTVVERNFSARSLDQMQEEHAKLTRFSSAGYHAPEFSSHDHNTAKYTSEQRRVQNIYCLGALLFELLADHQIPMISLGNHLIRRVELVPAHELHPDAPSKLSEILQAMLAYDPVDRYQTYDEIIADLEGLQIASARVSFVQRESPLANAAEIETTQKRQWLHRGEDYDFRRLHWGMTHDAIREAETDNLKRVMPGTVMIDTEFKGLKLQVIYMFAQVDDRMIGIGAMLSPLDFTFALDIGSIARTSPEDLTERLAQGESESIEDLGARLLERRSKNREQSASGREEMQRSQFKLNVSKVQDTYRTMKELITIGYGAPDVEDGPLLESSEYVDLIVKSNEVDREEVLRYCQSSVWRTNSTYATLTITPGPMGTRQILAHVVSQRHSHLLSK